MDPGATASDYFGKLVREYDSLIRRAVPDYAEMLRRSVTYLPEHAERVLELGCGTGNFSLLLRERFAEAELTLVDASEDMLAASAGRLEEARPPRLLAKRFEDLDAADGSYDLIASCISLHHVRDKAPVFAVLRALVEPGGSLLITDQMGGQTAANHAINTGAMRSFWTRGEGCTPEERESLLDHERAHDFHEPILSHVRLLEAAGFDQVDVVWRNWMWGVITARAAG